MSGIIFLSYVGGPGGPASQQAHHINYLLEQRERVTIVDENPEYTLAKVNPVLMEQLEVIQLPVWSQPAKVVPYIKSLAKTSESTIIVLNNPGVLVRYYKWLRKASRQRSVRVVMTLRSGMLTMTLRRYVLEWAISFSCFFLREVTFVSHYTRRYWERRYPWMRFCKGIVIHNGVTIPEGIEQRPKPVRLRVGFVGRVLKEKGPQLFCEIAKAGRLKNVLFEFHLYGDGPMTSELEAAYQDCVEWHGFVNDIKSIYPNIDVLLMTSPIENCPNSLLEAKSYGVPVISAPVGGIPEIVENGVDGILLADPGLEPYLEALKKIYENYGLFNQGCLKNRHRFSARHLIEETWAKRGIPIGSNES